MLQVVRILHSHGAAKWLERTTGCSPRTADYWLSGRYLPRGNRGLLIVAALAREHRERGRVIKQFVMPFVK